MKYVKLIKGRDYAGRGIKAYRGKPLAVEDGKADELAASGFFHVLGDVATQEVHVAECGNPDAEDLEELRLDKMKTAELEEFAIRHNIDISACRTNAERAAVIKDILGNGNKKFEESGMAEPDFGSWGQS